MNFVTDRGVFVSLQSNPSRVGILVQGCALDRTVLWLDDFTFEDHYYKEFIEAKKPEPQKIPGLATLTKAFYKKIPKNGRAELIHPTTAISFTRRYIAKKLKGGR
jgi:hypothetical protein